jgi:hypothetical protein
VAAGAIDLRRGRQSRRPPTARRYPRPRRAPNSARPGGSPAQATPEGETRTFAPWRSGSDDLRRGHRGPSHRGSSDSGGHRSSHLNHRAVATQAPATPRRRPPEPSRRWRPGMRRPRKATSSLARRWAADTRDPERPRAPYTLPATPVQRPREATRPLLPAVPDPACPKAGRLLHPRRLRARGSAPRGAGADPSRRGGCGPVWPEGHRSRDPSTAPGPRPPKRRRTVARLDDSTRA